MAEAQKNYTQDELRALPRSCLAQQFINASLHGSVVPEEERKEWAARLGEKDYSHFHHYCWGLIHLRRGTSSSNPMERDSNYRASVSNFEYVQRNASPTFPLMPEIYLRKGLTLRLLSQHAEATNEFQTALKIKPDYSPAYAALIDLYVDLGDLEAAHKVLETGLTQAPNSKILEGKKDELLNRGGKPQ